MSQSSSDDPWCRRYRPARDPAARLVCLPYAGGSAAYFRPVAMALDPSVDVVAVQYPGRQDRRGEPAISDMQQLADRVHEVLDRQPELPLTLFGHSMGALLAFEVARRRQAAGRIPDHLFVSGRRAPSAHREECVHRRDDAGILAELRSLDGTAALVLQDEEMMRAAIPALRADYAAAENYRCPPGVTVAAPITALTGDGDPKTTIAEADAWRRHTTGAFELQIYRGGHFFLADHAAQVNAMLGRHFAASARAPRAS
ncbi:thioesterase [Actinocrinis puniceicyclus]|uniref:Thioesterase n=1 Tax=Actinocrinis puniceicyclus TaxID=977794 RepID=A0A8J7WSA4_9ACTN|nr:alpha/beta fold hydrolase [Actinocrinis puniceicyclus]MBS2964399.1 thioesterase [Actinocrinis puniceicyclus]